MTKDYKNIWLSLFLTEHLQEGQDQNQTLFYVVYAVRLGIREITMEGVFTDSSTAKRFCKAIDSSLAYFKNSSSMEALPLQTIIDISVGNRLGKLAEVLFRLENKQ